MALFEYERDEDVRDNLPEDEVQRFLKAIAASSPEEQNRIMRELRATGNKLYRQALAFQRKVEKEDERGQAAEAAEARKPDPSPVRRPGDFRSKPLV